MSRHAAAASFLACHSQLCEELGLGILRPSRTKRAGGRTYGVTPRYRSLARNAITQIDRYGDIVGCLSSHWRKTGKGGFGSAHSQNDSNEMSV